MPSAVKDLPLLTDDQEIAPRVPNQYRCATPGCPRRGRLMRRRPERERYIPEDDYHVYQRVWECSDCYMYVWEEESAPDRIFDAVGAIRGGEAVRLPNWVSATLNIPAMESLGWVIDTAEEGMEHELE